MITTEPVGEWFWEPSPVLDAAASGASRAVALVGEVRDVLASLGLVGDGGTGSVEVCELSAMGRPVFERRDVPLDVLAGQAAAVRLLPDQFLTVVLRLPGEWAEAGVRRRAEELFVVRVHLWGQGGTVLAMGVYADPWLTQDLRERPQPEVAAENAPRLAAALGRISALTRSEVDPGDETRHARPTPDGFADLLAEEAAYADSWGTFEVPARWRRLMKLLPGGYGEGDYEATTEEAVRYAEVRCGERLLGFLWASADGAAGYEPRSAAGDAAFGAGVPWLLRFRAARSGGAGASAALDGCLGRTEAGVTVGAVVHRAPSLDALQELSGRG
ncbi:hypothetical protein [Streptomyces lavendulae]|uniref:hypothetical protein n=1 Tax=Streptomyces lavendulae TaxID=1914 RepID=UPI0024A3AFE9|nr:hypothetical protein [Streptomyces lavendulae]GLX20585.1 hypothetical protein Slala01_42290 [Streptomyces lavendulae subsp. lavendulae]GLX28253.1 hypothetical protein Slala02_40730 [Streptomyces lavendulae subsp. lavendulae]